MTDRPTEPIRILIHSDEAEELAAKLSVAFEDICVETCTTYPGLPVKVRKFAPHVVYSVRFDGTPGFPRDALFTDNGPRWIANGGSGTDHYEVWDPARVTVTNAAGVAADMMAEYVMGAFLHFSLDIPGCQADKVARRWDIARRVAPLRGSTVLIVGLGHTGRAIAARAKGFGMTVLGTRARPSLMQDVDEVHPPDRLQSLLPRADFVAVATPLTEQTRSLIAAAEIEAMKQGVILADVSRGGVIDQAALPGALKSGRIAGAALDVFQTEPLPDDHPLWQVENLIISPHCSSVYDGWGDASFDFFLRNLARWMDGQTLFNIVDPARGY